MSHIENADATEPLKGLSTAMVMLLSVAQSAYFWSYLKFQENLNSVRWSLTNRFTCRVRGKKDSGERLPTNSVPVSLGLGGSPHIHAACGHQLRLPNPVQAEL